MCDNDAHNTLFLCNNMHIHSTRMAYLCKIEDFFSLLFGK